MKSCACGGDMVAYGDGLLVCTPDDLGHPVGDMRILPRVPARDQRTDAPVTEPEPVGYDGQGAPIYGYQLGNRLDDETRRLLLERVERGDA